MKAFSTVCLLIAAFFVSACPITITVSKSGSADVKSIKDALLKAQPGDVIKIMDIATYEEQVTVDSTKYPLTLTSSNPTSRTKPTIKFQDKINVGPRTFAESQRDSMVTYMKNGALRIMKARNVIIDGIAIDGGGAYPYGYPSIWEARYSLQSGNAAVMLYRAGDIVIRNCDISNAYFGIYTHDHNLGGIYAQANPADYDTSPVVPLSGYGLTGNNLYEYNRIHNNSWGMFFESQWDQGSTIRYNLIFENHHATDSTALKVRNLTSDEGANQSGGALFFKDAPLSPLAIYNNTFWRNFALLSGHWQAGYQHLVFNNIFGTPNKYWSSSTPNFNTEAMELTPVLVNRMYNCVYSAQTQAPQATYVRILNNVGQLQGAGGTSPAPGTLILANSSAATAFPASANVRWLEMDSAQFLSVNPASPDFLEPKWSDTIVQKFVARQGWEASGIKNSDGSRADLGAVEQARGKPGSVATIKSSPLPIMFNGLSAQLGFTLDEREGTTLTDPVITLFRLVRTPFTKGSFGNNEKTMIIGAGDITNLNPPTTPPLKIGPNSYSVAVPVINGDYAFIEMIVEARGSDGKSFSASGFLPYRNIDYMLSVEILDTTLTKVLTEVRVGEPVVLHLTPQKTSTEIFSLPINPVSVALISGFTLLTPGNPPTELVYPAGLPGGVDNKIVLFTKIPEGGIENITAAGKYTNPSTGTVLPFLGGTSVKVLPGPADDIKFIVPPSSASGMVPPSLPLGSTFACTLLVVDKYGNACGCSKSVKIANWFSTSRVKVLYIGADSSFKSDSNGVVGFSVQASENANLDDMIGLIANMAGSSKIDTAQMIVGPRVSVIDPRQGFKSLVTPIGTAQLTISIFDLQGRRVFHRTFSSADVKPRQALVLSGITAGLPAKAYVVETIVKDRISMKQTRSVQKIMVR
jgi:hypothetical protein